MGNRCARLERLSSGANDGYSGRLSGFPATFRHFRKPLRDLPGEIGKLTPVGEGSVAMSAFMLAYLAALGPTITSA